MDSEICNPEKKNNPRNYFACLKGIARSSGASDDEGHMKCPACSTQTTKKNVDGVELDVCDGGCAGIWFDQHEIKKLDEKHEMPESFLKALDASKKIEPNHDRPRNCPKCETIVMMRHFYSAKRQVEVDQCPNCAGFWLDCGELTKVHSLFPRDSDRIAANERFIEEAFRGDLNQMAAESQAKLAQAKKIAQIFRFILPSYYLPGKQSGGAF